MMKATAPHRSLAAAAIGSGRSITWMRGSASNHAKPVNTRELTWITKSSFRRHSPINASLFSSLPATSIVPCHKHILYLYLYLNLPR